MPGWQPKPGASSSKGAAPRAAPSSPRNTGASSPGGGHTAATQETRKEIPSQYRLRKQNRLLDAADFGRVFAKATRSRDKWFTVLCRTSDAGPARLGLAISRKSCRRATGRNRIKRIVRESFRQHKDTLEGLDIVVISNPATASAENRELFASLAQHWQKCANSRGRTGTGRAGTRDHG